MKTFSLLIILFGIGVGNCANCPSLWTSYDNSCYKFFKERYTFFEAKSLCNIIHAELVEVDTMAENNFVKNMGHTGVEPSLWMGLEDFVDEGTFVWASSGQPPNFSNWRPLKPTLGGTYLDCVGMATLDGKWYDLNCENKMAFVCKMPAGGGHVDGGAVVG